MGAPAGRKPLICLGEGLVDLIGPDPAGDAGGERDFEVHFGGALANVAVAARRAGAPVALASGCGRDRWGRFLLDRLRAEGIDLTFYAELDDVPTAFAFAFLGPGGEPEFEIHGEGIDASIASLVGRERELVDAAAAIAFGSNTLVSEASRAITTEISRLAGEAGVTLLFDPNLRPGRWEDLDRAREICLRCVAVVDVVKCNVGEARWLLADSELSAEEAAEELHRLGPQLAVVTAGTDPVVARGATEASVVPPAVEVVSPLGAGDNFMGTLAAGLYAAGFDLSEAGSVLRDAADAAARTCTHIGAFGR